MKKKNNIYIYISIIIFVVVFLAFGMFLRKSLWNSSKEDEVCVVVRLDNNIIQTVNSWYNSSDSCNYVFLPANTRKISLSGLIKIDDDWLFVNEMDIDKIKTNDIYSYKNNDKTDEITIVFMMSSNIPSLFISTDSGNMDYIYEKKGNAEIGTFLVCSQNSNECDSGKISEFAGRGNTSWTDCEKKGFRIQLSEEKSMLGMKSSENWVLVANARSNYLSNSVAFWLEEQIGMEYTNARFVDLYLNGSYNGNYILCEKIEVGKSGVDICDLEKENQAANQGQKIKKRNSVTNDSFNAFLWENEPDDITGGYLIERDVPEYYAEEKSGIKTLSGDCYVVHSPSHISVGEANYLLEYMNDMYEAVSNVNGTNSKGKYYLDYLDIEGFAKKYVLEEFLNFNDAGRSSAYYYKDKGGKLTVGPGWDFESAFGGNAEYLTLLNGTLYSTDLYEKLMQHEDFQNYAYKIYNEKLLPAVQELLSTKFNEFCLLIKDSVQMDKIRWNRESFEESNKEKIEWINNRIDFLSKQFDSSENWVCVKIVSDWKPYEFYYIRPGECIPNEIIQNYKIDGVEISGWTDIEGNKLDFEKPLYEDIQIVPVVKSENIKILNIVFGNLSSIYLEIIFAVCGLVLLAVYFIKTKKGKYFQ